MLFESVQLIFDENHLTKKMGWGDEKDVICFKGSGQPVIKPVVCRGKSGSSSRGFQYKCLQFCIS
jgi:hypothetical protein